MGWSAKRYHDISCGHRVVGHEGKCKHFHGHNYRIHFKCKSTQTTTQLDQVGRVIDFSDIKHRLCEWLEDNWDHKMLLWEQDPQAIDMVELDPDGVVLVPFNPTAENIAEHLVKVVGPDQLKGTGIALAKCHVEETRKCGAEYEL